MLSMLKQKSLSFLENKYLNRPFVLWILSTLLIGGLSWCYKKYEDNRTIKRENLNLVRKLDFEIANRLYAYDNQVKSNPDDWQSKLFILLYSPVDDKTSIKNIYPEFKERTLRSLLWELIGVVPDDEKPVVFGAYESLSKLDSLGNEYPADIANTNKILKEKFRLKRWKMP